MSRFILRRDEGLTVVELMVASIITVIVSGLMITWLVAVTRSDVFQEQDLSALDELRIAKGRLVKELRFAESIGTADPHLVKFYADFDRDGMQTSDEFVTWEIQSDGTLVRFTDATPSTKVPQAEGLVYDSGAAAGSSRFLYVAPNNNPVTIELVADIDLSEGPGAKSIRTQVRIRNLPTSGSTTTTSTTTTTVASFGIPIATLSTSAPTASTLPNYDPGRDAFPGLLLAKADIGAPEIDPTKYQKWVALPGALNLNGPAPFTFWSAMKDFNTTKRGIVDAWLLDCLPSGTSCQVIAQGQMDQAPWSGGSSTWVEYTIDFGTVNYLIAADRSLAVKVAVNNNSDDDMWFAFDTTSYPSRVDVTVNSTSIAYYLKAT